MTSPIKNGCITALIRACYGKVCLHPVLLCACSLPLPAKGPTSPHSREAEGGTWSVGWGTADPSAIMHSGYSGTLGHPQHLGPPKPRLSAKPHTVGHRTPSSLQGCWCQVPCTCLAEATEQPWTEKERFSRPSFTSRKNLRFCATSGLASGGSQGTCDNVKSPWLPLPPRSCSCLWGWASALCLVQLSISRGSHPGP